MKRRRMIGAAILALVAIGLYVFHDSGWLQSAAVENPHESPASAKQSLPDSRPADSAGSNARRVNPLIANLLDFRGFEPNPKARPSSKIPTVDKYFRELESQFKDLEIQLAIRVDGHSGKDHRVDIYRLEEFPREKLDPFFTKLSKDLATFPDADRADFKAERDIFLKEFLKFPKRYKYIVLTQFPPDSKTRPWLQDFFSDHGKLKVLTAEGGLIQYGNDFFRRDPDTSQSHSWALRRYGKLFGLKIEP